MTRNSAIAHAALCAAALLLSACTTTPLPPDTPGATAPGALLEPPALGWFSNIKVPEGSQPVLRLAARGVQIFRCEQRNAAYNWGYRLPEAELIDDRGVVVARHGVDFSFEHTDGSRLLGKVQASDSAPGNDNLPWLLLSMRSFGEGAFKGVEYVQRMNTRGGMPPARCEAKQSNQLLRVDFSAEFIFYRPR